jgi:hypothetical protein
MSNRQEIYTLISVHYHRLNLIDCDIGWNDDFREDVGNLLELICGGKKKEQVKYLGFKSFLEKCNDQTGLSRSI